MNYTKPEVIAKNQPTGTFAAGCPAENTNTYQSFVCKECERAQ